MSKTESTSKLVSSDTEEDDKPIQSVLISGKRCIECNSILHGNTKRKTCIDCSNEISDSFKKLWTLKQFKRKAIPEEELQLKRQKLQDLKDEMEPIKQLVAEQTSLRQSYNSIREEFKALIS